MEAFDSIRPEEQLERIKVLARNVLLKFGLPLDSGIELVNYSENITYEVSNSHTGERFALRVHRPGYHTLQNIESELTWMMALSRQARVYTPEPVLAPDGKLVHTAGAPGVPQDRYCVLFRWLDGKFPEENELVESFGLLGEVTARLHAHARSWKLPVGFKRQTWDLELMFGENPVWGPWQNGIGLTGQDRKLLDRLEDTLRRRLDRFGKSPEHFGLIHADLRLDNLLIENGETKVIDFDDCGFGWYLYDFGTAVSFIEHRADMDELITSWVDGYRSVGPLSKEEENELPTFIMMRRLLLTAWVSSHSDTKLAQEQGIEYTHGTCSLAEDYLTKYG